MSTWVQGSVWATSRLETTKNEELQVDYVHFDSGFSHKNSRYLAVFGRLFWATFGAFLGHTVDLEGKITNY